MKIGDKVRIKEALAGANFIYVDNEIVEITHQNIDIIEGLLRGGSAEAETFQATPEANRGTNESVDIHTDDAGGIEPGIDSEPVKTKRRGVRRPDGDKG